MGNKFALYTILILGVILAALLAYSYKKRLDRYFGRQKKKTSFKTNFLIGASYILKNTPIFRRRYAKSCGRSQRAHIDDFSVYGRFENRTRMAGSANEQSMNQTKAEEIRS